MVERTVRGTTRADVVEEHSRRRALRCDTLSAVRVDGGLSDWFSPVVGVFQGSVLSLLLFNIFLDVVMILALGEDDIGVCVDSFVILNLRFADDISLLSDSDNDNNDNV